MNTLDVPCPLCGSVQVVVGDRAEAPSAEDWAGDGSKSRTPLLHRCQCRNCRHTFQHDFSFGR